ncbi:MAG TPA: hypothetical protein ENN07_03015 [candidate division Zixibacteria bacterium]|nr:hypothetical protein [candidate division Zixibacteria bacterium]
MDYLRDTSFCDLTFDFAVISGSGLAQSISDFGEIIERQAYKIIPGYPTTSVKGHDGELIVIKFRHINKMALVFSGRTHLYEGVSIDDLLFQVRLANLLGIKTIIISCAVGTLNDKTRPGELGLITDQIDTSMILSPSHHQRINIYNRDLSELLFDTALNADIPITRGTLCSILGPTYETPAEAQMAHVAGADWMSMSTAKETAEASRLGMAVVGIAGITNVVNAKNISHDDVVLSAKSCSERFWRLLSDFSRKYK